MINTEVLVSQERIADFCRRWQVVELSLFGSAIRSDFEPASDVDVLVSFEHDAPWTLWDLATMRRELVEIFGREVDLVEQQGLRNPYRRRAILSHRHVLYAA
jgi:predicted nucleotidyltransferase